MKKYLFTLGAILILPLLITSDSAAQSIQIRPLLYEQQLTPGEVKKGHVDIANPLNRPVTLQIDVKGFRQIDNAGNLEFSEVDYLNEAITPDFDEFILEPKEAMRLYFTIDSRRLPEGDIFAALFARTTSPDSSEGIGLSAEVGTLLVLQNGEGGQRQVALSNLGTSFFQFGEAISGSVTIRNTANPETSTGFFPQFTATIGPAWPSETSFKGPLVSAGRERQVRFTIPANYVGFYELKISSHGAETSQWLFAITGWWRWIALGLLAISIIVVFGWQKFHKKRIHYHARPK